MLFCHEFHIVFLATRNNVGGILKHTKGKVKGFTRLPALMELSYMYPGQVAKQSENVEKPQNYDNDHKGIQNRLDRSRHWNVPVDESQHDTHYDQH
jgi:hypothetical protein